LRLYDRLVTQSLFVVFNKEKLLFVFSMLINPPQNINEDGDCTDNQEHLFHLDDPVPKTRSSSSTDATGGREANSRRPVPLGRMANG